MLAEEKDDMEHLEAYNRKLLANILPVHVAEHFLSVDKPVDVSSFHKQQTDSSNSKLYNMAPAAWRQAYYKSRKTSNKMLDKRFYWLNTHS